MKKIFYLMLALASLNLTSCGYDDDEVWDAINNQENRIAALESWQKTANDNIAALQALVNGNDYITAVTPITENGETIGYTISFVKQGDIKIYHGAKGDKGDKGDTGVPGDKGDKGETGIAGSTPEIGLTQQVDGKWYWTLNGELMKDNEGNPICASGKDGEDGEDGNNGSSGSTAPTPQLKTGAELGNEYTQDAIYLSVDGGKTWKKVSGDDGSDGDDGIGFKEVVENSNSWSFIMSDGTTINVPKFTKLTLTYKNEPIKNGELSVGLDCTFSILCEVADGFTLSYEVLKNELGWTFNMNDNALEVTVNGSEGSVTVVFILTTEDNQAFFYKVKISTKVIKAEENPALVSALKSALKIEGEVGEEDIVITQELIEQTTELNLSDTKEKITSIEGLEYFTNLTSLDLSNNEITSVAGLENCENLTSLNISNNPISDVEEVKEALSQLPKLTHLDCSGCLTQSAPIVRSSSSNVLDLSGSNSLLYLDCSNNNLTELIVSTHSDLHTLRADSNLLTSLNLSANTKLTALYCSYNWIEELNIENCTELVTLIAPAGLNMTELDLSKNTKLETVWCNVIENRDYKLKSLNVNGLINLKVLYCHYNELNTLDLSTNKALTDVQCRFNKLTNLTLDHPNLTQLLCQGNSMDALDISKCTALQTLSCGFQLDNENKIKQLVLTISEVQQSKWESSWKNSNSNVFLADQEDGESKLITNTAFIAAVEESVDTTFMKNNDGYVDVNKNLAIISNITKLKISGKELTSLEGIEYFKNLEFLDCTDNGLRSLNLSENKKLSTLLCGNNYYQDDIETVREFYNRYTSLDLSLNTELERFECINAFLTELNVENNTKLSELRCSKNPLYTLDLSHNTELRLLTCVSNSLAALDLTNNVNLNIIECGDNQLTELEVSHLTKLSDLNAGHNQFTELDVSKNTNLTYLECSGNQLTTIDVTNNLLLDYFQCSDNLFTSIDISKNTELTRFACEMNRGITALDVSKNTKLKHLRCYSCSLTALDVTPLSALNLLRCGSQSGLTLTLTLTPSQQELWETDWSIKYAGQNNNVTLNVSE